MLYKGSIKNNNLINISLNKINYTDLLATLLIYLLTFPQFEPDYSIGLDTSYVWALNYLFNNDYTALKQIIYPLGPLAFLKNAIIEGNNFEYFLIFYTIVKVWFTYMFITISERFNKRKVVSYFVATIMLMLFNIDYLLIGITFIYSFLYLNHKKSQYIAIITSIAFISLSIKSSIGISCFSIIFIALILDYLKNHNFKSTLKFIGIVFLCVFFWGLLVFQNIEILFQYIINVLRLSISYSSALGVFPSNNWFLLSIFIACVLLPVFINKKITTKYVFFLLLPSLFAMWKHTMTREDFSHSIIMFNFLFLYWGFFIAVSGIEIKRLLFIAVISMSTLYSNIQNTWDFRPKKIEINGIVNFEKTVLTLNEFKKKYTTLSFNNTQANKLDKKIIDIVASSSIDSYPWELSYFAANDELNWKMRRTLQSGSYARWLDSVNAQDFNRENGPDFIILHYVYDKWGGELGSIDERFLLNDNPLTIYNIFNNYSVTQKTDAFLLLKKNKRDNFISQEIDKKLTSKWNNWINIQESKEEIIRLKVFSELNLIGKIKNFLYKSEQYYVDYMLKDGKIYTYRYIPENAKDGIWINPFLRNPKSNYIEDNIVKIRFRCTYPFLNKDEFEYQIEKSYFSSDKSSEYNDFNSYFYKNIITQEDIIINCTNNFEDTTNEVITNISNTFSYSGKKSNKVLGNGGFSYTYSVKLDTLWEKIDTCIHSAILETDIKYWNENSHAVYVVALSESNNDFWNGVSLNNTYNFWDNSLQTVKLDRNMHNKGILSIYVWNTGGKNIFIDDFRIKIKIIGKIKIQGSGDPESSARKSAF